ncbi:hypothetical protein EYC80_007180 [Monilinia laxa]|uniref:Uncharacterized protein n=1 Tax=Monilinia laxa TaxID=61186 RepID=A0A5N6K0G3_MONLA|nr:hypothetical protein EYC80_007180 [Monilinia laxa]
MYYTVQFSQISSPSPAFRPGQGGKLSTIIKTVNSLILFLDPISCARKAKPRQTQSHLYESLVILTEHKTSMVISFSPFPIKSQMQTFPSPSKMNPTPHPDSIRHYSHTKYCQACPSAVNRSSCIVLDKRNSLINAFSLTPGDIVLYNPTEEEKKKRKKKEKPIQCVVRKMIIRLCLPYKNPIKTPSL